MRRRFVAALVATGLARAAFALVDAAADSASVINERVYADSRAPMASESTRLEEAQQEQARQRAERIRRLPPDKVQQWAAGEMSDEELERLTSAPDVPEEEVAVADAAVTWSKGRLLRLGAAATLATVLAALVWRRRRQEQVDALAARRPTRA